MLMACTQHDISHMIKYFRVMVHPYLDTFAQGRLAIVALNWYYD